MPHEPTGEPFCWHLKPASKSVEVKQRKVAWKWRRNKRRVNRPNVLFFDLLFWSLKVERNATAVSHVSERHESQRLHGCLETIMEQSRTLTDLISFFFHNCVRPSSRSHKVTSNNRAGSSSARRCILRLLRPFTLTFNGRRCCKNTPPEWHRPWLEFAKVVETPHQSFRAASRH